MYKRQDIATAVYGPRCLCGKDIFVCSGRIETARPAFRIPVSYTHLRAHETVLALVCRLLLETQQNDITNVLFLDTQLQTEQQTHNYVDISK